MKKELTVPQMLGICLGDFARAILSGLIVTYALKFFNVTPSSGLPLLIPAGMLGTLRGIGVFFDALTDPWVAELSDNCKSKHGRRIPFMRWASIPYALVCLLIFFPPDGEVTTTNIVWVAVMLLLYYLFSTFYNVPFNAFEQEIVTDTKKRVFFFTLDSLMFVTGSAVIYVLPVMISAFKAGGMEPIVAWRLAMAIFAAIGAVCCLMPTLVVKEKDYIETYTTKKVSILESFKAAFSYKQFTIMTIGYLIMQAGFAFFNGALLFYIDTLLGLNDSFATIVLALSIVVGVCTYPLVNKLVRRYGKKPLLLGACIAYVVIYTGIYFYEPISNFFGTQPIAPGFIASLAGEGAQVGSVIAAFLIGVGVAFPIACTNILPPAAFADMAQYDRIKTGVDHSGMFVASRQFCNKVAQAGVTVIVSYTMYLGATDNYPTQFGVRMTALIAAVLLAISVFVYSRYQDKDIVAYIDEYNAKKNAAE